MTLEIVWVEGLMVMMFWKWEKLLNFKVYVLLQPICAGELSVVIVISPINNSNIV